MRIAYWITEAKNTHLEYVILIAFPRKQWLQERASMLRCTYIALKLIQKHEIICRNITETLSSYLAENTFLHRYIDQPFTITTETVPAYCENLTESVQCVKKYSFRAF
jgi:hypothetical protein